MARLLSVTADRGSSVVARFDSAIAASNSPVRVRCSAYHNRVNR